MSSHWLTVSLFLVFPKTIRLMAAGSQSSSGRGPTSANNSRASPPSALSDSKKVRLLQDAKTSMSEDSKPNLDNCALDSIVKNGENDKSIDENGQDKPELDIVINNVVSSFNVRCHLNLRDIALRGLNVEYRKENGVR